MKAKLILIALSAGLLASCSFDAPYAPVTKAEKVEFRNDRQDIYPEDVRKDPARYANLTVAWAGIIVSNNAMEEDLGGRIRMETIFDHRYFDWEQDEEGPGMRLLISPRGEGLFRSVWYMKRDTDESSDEDAMKYAAPGKLAIVYASPKSVDDNGTIEMHYHFIRVVDRTQFTANELEYGRIPGEPFRPIEAKRPKITTNSPSH